MATNAPTSSPTVTKARIVVVKADGTKDESKSLTCMYNPASLEFGRTATWTPHHVAGKDHPEYSYEGGGPSDFTVELWFDTTQTMTDPAVQAGEDVRKFTKFIFSLLDLSEPDSQDPTKRRPPYCQFEWGGGKHVLIGVVSNVTATYNFFLPDGTPLRAKVKVTFKEIKSEQQLGGQTQNPTSASKARKTWVVREGERLDWIAYQEYGDAAQWRHIAQTNGLDNPFDLRPGQVLKLVPLP